MEWCVIIVSMRRSYKLSMLIHLIPVILCHVSQSNSMELAELREHNQTNIYILTCTRILAHILLDNIMYYSYVWGCVWGSYSIYNLCQLLIPVTGAVTE